MPARGRYSETFIRAHVEHLPFHCEELWGGFFPYYGPDGRPLVPLPLRALNRVLASGLGFDRRRLDARYLARFLGSRDYAVLLAEYGPTGVETAASCRQAAVPLVVHFHGYDAYSREVLDRYGPSYPQVFQAAAAVIAVSRDMVEQLARLGAPRSRIHYVPYGVDPVLFSGAEPSGAPPVFVAVGRFVDKKAPLSTLEAFAGVLQRVPTARLVMAGDGDLLEPARQFVASRAIGDAVVFPGAVAPVEVARLMRGARAFVQHSVITDYGDSEGLPLAILEAQASGLPVVATRHAGIKDVVVEGETGLLVGEHDVDAMAGAMEELARAPSLAARMGAAGRNRILAHFTVDHNISCLAAVLTKAAAAGNSAEQR